MGGHRSANKQSEAGGSHRPLSPCGRRRGPPKPPPGVRPVFLCISVLQVGWNYSHCIQICFIISFLTSRSLLSCCPISLLPEVNRGFESLSPLPDSVARLSFSLPSAVVHLMPPRLH